MSVLTQLPVGRVPRHPRRGIQDDRRCDEGARRHPRDVVGGRLAYRAGCDARGADQEAFLNVEESGSHTPGVAAGRARRLAERPPLRGPGGETAGADAGRAMELDTACPRQDPPRDAGTYGLTQRRNLDRWLATEAVLVVCPLPMVGGTGGPAAVLALVGRDG